MATTKTLSATISCILLSALFTTSCSADLIFGLNFTSQASTDLTQSEKNLFNSAINFWDAIIVGHQDLVPRTWTLTVDTFSQPASGGGVVLGSAGPTNLMFSGVVPGAATSNERFVIAGGGNANFNTHPDTNGLGLNLDTIKHEIGHALGFGALWELNEVYNDGNPTNSSRTLDGGTPGQYVGANALAAWQNEYVGQSAATFIPVELAGGPGTAHGHWNEDDNFGQANTGIVRVSDGRDLRHELLTGFASNETAFLSQTTIASFEDIGFIVVTVPEPSGLAVLGMLGLGIALRRRR